MSWNLDTNVKSFGSDNHSGVHPEIMNALNAANVGHAHSYGLDVITELTRLLFKEKFGPHAETFFVFNGTAANVVALSHLLKSYESVICAETSHLHMDECGAPEFISGIKLMALPSSDGKITVEQIREQIIRRGDQHFRQPRIVSITQPTELGTVYSLKEIGEIAKLAHENKMYLHVDGSRLANAAITLNVSLENLTSRAGVDVVSLGGTKNGLLMAEAVIFFSPDLARDFQYLRKQSMQLGSKMRFTAAQFHAYLSNDLYLKIAGHSCAMAQYLQQAVSHLPRVRVTQKVQSNAVFAEIPKEAIKRVREKFFFYVWNENTYECRWMTSFDTTTEDINAFAEHLAKSL